VRALTETQQGLQPRPHSPRAVRAITQAAGRQGNSQCWMGRAAAPAAGSGGAWSWPVVERPSLLGHIEHFRRKLTTSRGQGSRALGQLNGIETTSSKRILPDQAIGQQYSGVSCADPHGVRQRKPQWARVA